MRRPPTPQYDHRINEHIRIPKIRVVDDEGDQLGIMTPDRARLIARDRGLDLVEVAPNARPPVCRIMDYGKFRYEQSKRKSAAKSHTQQLKIVQLRPKTDTHDLETKLRRAKSFLRKGDKVRLVMRLRGRERGLVHRWKAQMRELVESLGDLARTSGPPRAEGRAVSILLEPGEALS